jgi:hypothetical protein
MGVMYTLSFAPMKCDGLGFRVLECDGLGFRVLECNGLKMGLVFMNASIIS